MEIAATASSSTIHPEYLKLTAEKSGTRIVGRSIVEGKTKTKGTHTIGSSTTLMMESLPHFGHHVTLQQSRAAFVINRQSQYHSKIKKNKKIKISKEQSSSSIGLNKVEASVDQGSWMII